MNTEQVVMERWLNGPQIRCHYCGRFMSDDDIALSVTYTPYGGYDDIDPPDERFIHGLCWDKAHPDGGEVWRGGMWIGPTDHRPAQHDGQERTAGDMANG